MSSSPNPHMSSPRSTYVPPLQLVAWSEVEPFLKLFDEFDADGSGKLDTADVELIEAHEASMKATAEAIATQGAAMTNSNGSGAKQSRRSRVCCVSGTSSEEEREGSSVEGPATVSASAADG